MAPVARLGLQGFWIMLLQQAITGLFLIIAATPLTLWAESVWSRASFLFASAGAVKYSAPWVWHESITWTRPFHTTEHLKHFTCFLTISPSNIGVWASLTSADTAASYVCAWDSGNLSLQLSSFKPALLWLLLFFIQCNNVLKKSGFHRALMEIAWRQQQNQDERCCQPTPPHPLPTLPLVNIHPWLRQLRFEGVPSIWTGVSQAMLLRFACRDSGVTVSLCETGCWCCTHAARRLWS